MHSFGRIAACKYDFVCPELEAAKHSCDIFVVVASEDNDHRIVRHMLADGFHQGLDAGGVVSSVNHNARVIANHFHPTRQRNVFQTCGGFVLIDFEAAGFQFIEHGQSQSAIDGLMSAMHRNAKVFESAGRSGQANPSMRAVLARGFKAIRKINVFAGYA